MELNYLRKESKVTLTSENEFTFTNNILRSECNKCLAGNTKQTLSVTSQVDFC